MLQDPATQVVEVKSIGTTGAEYQAKINFLPANGASLLNALGGYYLSYLDALLLSDFLATFRTEACFIFFHLEPA